jgi:hypothetical protein
MKTQQNNKTEKYKSQQYIPEKSEHLHDRKLPIPDNGNSKKLAKTGKKPGPPKLWTESKAMQLARDMVNYYEKNSHPVCLADFCSARGLYVQKISELANEFPRFSEHLKRIKSVLESRIVDRGMVARNPVFPIFMLKNHHGYKDQHDLNVSGQVVHEHVANINRAWQERIESSSQAVQDVEYQELTGEADNGADDA